MQSRLKFVSSFTSNEVKELPCRMHSSDTRMHKCAMQLQEKLQRRHTAACWGTKSGGRDDECKPVQNKQADRAMQRRIAENDENSEELLQPRDAPKERDAIVTIDSNCWLDWLFHRSNSSPRSTVARQQPRASGPPGALSCSNPYRHPCCMPVRWNEVA